MAISHKTTLSTLVRLFLFINHRLNEVFFNRYDILPDLCMAVVYHKCHIHIKIFILHFTLMKTLKLFPSPRIGLHLFDQLIKPIYTLYGYEICSLHNIMKSPENEQTVLLRNLRDEIYTLYGTIDKNK